MKFTILLTALILSGCTIVRYYDTKKLRPQVAKLQTKSTATIALVEQDYARKERMIETAKAQGVNLSESPQNELGELFGKLSASRKDLVERTTKLQGSAAELMSHIGDKKKVESTDPRFTEIEKFRGKSEDELDEINDGLKIYQKDSNRFNDVADKLGFRWINVNQFKQQLVGVIGLIKLQCDSLDEKLTKAGVTARTTKDRDDVGEMRKDVVALRGVQSELKDFLGKFEKSTAGKSEYILTPKHPQAELFKTLGPIQERADQIIASLGWTQPWFQVSAISREGTWSIMKDVMAFFDRQKEEVDEATREGG